MLGIVLLPGAGMSSWLWTKTFKDLKLPALCISPRLETNNAKARLESSFEDLINYHIACIEAQKWSEIIIVAHSGAGLIAACLGKRLSKLVSILFVAANIPKQGDSALDIFPQELQKHTIKALEQQAQMDSIALKSMETSFIPAFANECSEADKQYLCEQQFLPEPLCVLEAKMDWTDYPSFDMTYIVCTKDKTLTVSQQLALANNLLIKDIVMLESDHLPMISAPEKFISILNNKIEFLLKTRNN